MIRNATELVTLVENRLGWDPVRLSRSSGKPVWKVVAAEAGKLNKQVAKDPDLLTWENLELTVEWLHRKRTEVQTPTAVCWFVRDAIKDAPVPAKADDLGEAIQEAIDLEMVVEREGYQEWAGMLSRASGKGRAEVLAAWRKERGTLFAVSRT